MEQYYLEIRTVHIIAVLLSGALFLLRAAAFNLSATSWPMSWPLRSLAYTIDTILLTAALMLMTIVRQYPFADGWLTVKVVLLLFYIVLGYFALHGPARRVRLASLAGAMITFAYIFTVARAHHVLGIFA